MMQVEGFVQAIETKPTSTGKTMYTVKVNGIGYGAGVYPPKVREGDYISFTYTMNGNFKNMETRTISNKLPPQGMTQQAAPVAAPKASGGGDWDSRQDIISKQAALNSAQHMVEILVTAGAVVGLEKAKTSADKMKVLTSLVDEFTMDYYNQNTGRKLNLPTGELADSGEEPAVKPSDWQ